MTFLNFVTSLYEDGETPKKEAIISAYEENVDLIDMQSPMRDTDEYDALMRLTSDYALALTGEADNSKKAMFLDKAIDMWQNCGLTSEELRSANYYTTLRFFRAKNFSDTKQLRKSLKEFRWLVNADSANTNYKNWLRYVRRRITTMTFRFLFITAFFLSVFCHCVPRDLFHNDYTVRIMKLSSDALLLATAAASLCWKLILQQSNTKPK